MQLEAEWPWARFPTFFLGTREKRDSWLKRERILLSIGISEIHILSYLHTTMKPQLLVGSCWLSTASYCLPTHATTPEKLETLNLFITDLLNFNTTSLCFSWPSFSDLSGWNKGCINQFTQIYKIIYNFFGVCICNLQLFFTNLDLRTHTLTYLVFLTTMWWYPEWK